MFLAEALKIALISLGQHKLRSLLTMLGMIFGVAAVLSMLSIGAGAEKEALSVIQKMGLKNIIVRAKGFASRELAILRQDSHGLSLRDIEALTQVLPSRSAVIGMKRLNPYQVVSPFGKSDSLVLGVSPLYPSLFQLQMLEGSFFLSIDNQDFRQVCVLGVAARRNLFGIHPALGQRIKINQQWFTVVGVLADQMIEKTQFQGVRIQNPNNQIFVPLKTLIAKFESDPIANELDEIVVRVPDDESVTQQAALLSAMMASLHNQVDDFVLVVPERLLQQNRKTQRIFNIVMGAIASISLLVGGIGIMNIMLASVLERTREIGLRRAVGARRTDISRQFVVEAVSISLSGALVGIGLGYGISLLVSSYSGWPTIITPISVILSVGVSASVGCIFGIYPARQASRISPIEALRYE